MIEAIHDFINCTSEPALLLFALAYSIAAMIHDRRRHERESS